MVDHRVVTDFDAFAIGELGRLALGPDVEADDDRVGGRREHDVGLGDRTDTAVDDTQRDIFADIDLGQGVFESFDRTRTVTLEDEQQFVGFALLYRRHEVFEGTTTAALGEQRIAFTRFTLFGNLAGKTVIGDNHEVVSGAGDRGQTEDQCRSRRCCFFDVVAVLVEQGPNPSEGGSGNDRVADLERASMDEDSGNGATSTIEVCFDDEAFGILMRIGPQVERGIRGQNDGSEQVIETRTDLGRDVDEHRVAAVLFGHETIFGELTADLGRIGVGLVDLVDRDDDRHAGGLGVVQRLNSLRHDAVIGRDHEDRDVGRLRTTGAHGGERLVAGCIDQGDAAFGAVDVGRDLVGADRLGDTAGFLLHDVRLAKGIEEFGLAVVDVTHDGDDRRTCHQILFVAFVLAEFEIEGLEEFTILVFGRNDLHRVVELFTEQLQGFVVGRLGCRHDFAQVEQNFHQRCRVDADLLGKVAERGTAGQAYGLAVALADADTANGGRLHLVVFLTLRAFALASTAYGAPGATERTLSATTVVAARATATGTAAEATATAGRSTGSTAARCSTAGTTGCACSCRCATTGTGSGATIATGRSAGATGTARATVATGAGATAESGRGLLGHHRRVRPRHTGACRCTAFASCSRRTRAPLHPLRWGKRVVARACTARTGRHGTRLGRSRTRCCGGFPVRGFGRGNRRLGLDDFGRSGLRSWMRSNACGSGSGSLNDDLGRHFFS